MTLSGDAVHSISTFVFCKLECFYYIILINRTQMLCQFKINIFKVYDDGSANLSYA